MPRLLFRLDLRTLHKFELFLVHCENWFSKLPEAAFPKLSIVSLSQRPLRFIMSYDWVWNMFVGSFFRMESYHTWLFAYFCLRSSRSLPFSETIQLGSRFQLLSIGYAVSVVFVIPFWRIDFFESDVPDMFFQGVALRVPRALLRGLIERKISLRCSQ